MINHRYLSSISRLGASAWDACANQKSHRLTPHPSPTHSRVGRLKQFGWVSFYSLLFYFVFSLRFWFRHCFWLLNRSAVSAAAAKQSTNWQSWPLGLTRVCVGSECWCATDSANNKEYDYIHKRGTRAQRCARVRCSFVFQMWQLRSRTLKATKGDTVAITKRTKLLHESAHTNIVHIYEDFFVETLLMYVFSYMHWCDCLHVCVCVALINSKFLHIRGKKDVLSTTSSYNTITTTLTRRYSDNNSSTKHIQFIILSLWGVLAAFHHCWQLLALRDSCGASHCVCVCACVCVCVCSCGTQQDKGVQYHTSKCIKMHQSTQVYMYVCIVGLGCVWSAWCCHKVYCFHSAGRKHDQEVCSLAWINECICSKLLTRHALLCASCVAVLVVLRFRMHLG